MDTKLSVSQQCDLDAREVNGVLDYGTLITASRSRKVRPHLECWVHFWAPSTRETWKY